MTTGSGDSGGGGTGPPVIAHLGDALVDATWAVWDALVDAAWAVRITIRSLFGG